MRCDRHYRLGGGAFTPPTELLDERFPCHCESTTADLLVEARGIMERLIDAKYCDCGGFPEQAECDKTMDDAAAFLAKTKGPA